MGAIEAAVARQQQYAEEAGMHVDASHWGSFDSECATCRRMAARIGISLAPAQK